jgi:hypothetical protein
MQDDTRDQESASWEYKPESGNSGNVSTDNAPIVSEKISWTASEYIAHPKSMSWFAMLGASTVVVAIIIFLVTKDYVSTAVIFAFAIIVGVFAARQPHVLEYHLDSVGLHMGQRFYPYNIFKSFSVIHEEAFSHITLLPLKRFMPPLTVHYAPTDEDAIIGTFSDYLPYEDNKRDLVESFTRKVRF